ncbi:hypothetical protein [Chitinophaga filiformis]|uniref:YD repeat-containing protein n=1 Tax=Chitinophaga filiformis TaxID=104663 RepID=A0ABY4IBV2_CHIFI|nr:hypothetical protein [Chitinophaga filiformis]UPK72281.1 hypothetical protein MYF79_13385 [Chitinophaga filiformis]
MRKLFFSSLVLGLLFVACDPQPDAIPDPVYPLKLLATDLTDMDSSALSYDAGRRLILFEQHEPADEFASYLKPVYENNRLTAALIGISKNDITHKFKTFEYNAVGELIKAYSYEYGFDKYGRYDSLVYNASGQIATIYVAAITEAGGSVALFQKNVLEWDTNKNITKKYSIAMKDDKETKDTTVTVYTYDNKINYTAQQPILFNLQMDEPADGLSANNVLTATTSSGSDSEVISNVFTYDNENYPVTVTTTTKQLYNGVVVDTRQHSHKLTYVKL